MSATCRRKAFGKTVSTFGLFFITLTLGKKHRLCVFENSVLRKMFGPKRDEVIGEWRRLHNNRAL
jgi:hypothetical protein